MAAAVDLSQVDAAFSSGIVDCESVEIMKSYNEWCLYGALPGAFQPRQQTNRGISNQPDEKDWLVRVPVERAIKVLGDRGAYIRRVRSESGAKIFMENVQEDQPQRNTWLSGREDQKTYALHMVLAVLGELPEDAPTPPLPSVRGSDGRVESSLPLHTTIAAPSVLLQMPPLELLGKLLGTCAKDPELQLHAATIGELGNMVKEATGQPWSKLHKPRHGTISRFAKGHPDSFLVVPGDQGLRQGGRDNGLRIARVERN
jgi:hypothetical protein